MVVTFFESPGFMNQTFSEVKTQSETLSNIEKCTDIDTYDFDHLKNNSNAKFLNSRSIIIDLGCDKTISTIDITWKNSSLVVYNYTLTILSDAQTIDENFSYTSNILPDNTTQTAGTKNTIGNQIILTITKPTNIKILDSVETISLHTPILLPQKTMSDEVLWNVTSNSYPSNLLIGTSEEMVYANIFRVTDGDNIDTINPYYVPSKILNVTNESSSFYIIIPFKPIEGITAKIESIRTPLILDSLNNTIIWDQLSKGDKIYFGKQFDWIKETDNSANLSIMLAHSSESALYFKSPIHLTE